MQEHHLDAEYRDYFKDPFTAEELDRLIGARPVSEFLSTRARSFQEQGWHKKPPTRKQAIAAIIADPTLLKRPLLIKGKRLLIGFSQSEYDKLIPRRRSE